MSITAVIPAEGLMSCWKSPSNIALIKYWGKHGQQLPRNASLSITLNQAYTVTRVRAVPSADPGNGPNLTFRFEGELQTAFATRIGEFLRSVTPWLEFLKDVDLSVETGNNFPHSAGIASSASGMSALALCLCSLDARIRGVEEEDPETFRKASFIARIGSGSACRSVYGGFTVWGEHTDVPGSSDEYAVPLENEYQSAFGVLHDSILIVDPGTKKVSSRAGHGLMNGHPYAALRFEEAGKNLSKLMKALESGDWDLFARITEHEALSLHAMMLTSDPWFVLMHPNTLRIIEEIKNFRKQTGAKVCFTLDAGPNIHLIYPAAELELVVPLLKSLEPFCHNGQQIHDTIGEGPVKLTCR